MKYKIGLTGLIGSGKSLAATYFAALGIDVIDTDMISHSLTTANGIAIPLITKAFGQDYLTLTGALDRAKMRRLIFTHQEERHKLELILHPLIFDEVVAMAAQSNSVYTIIVVPLLFQTSKYAKYMDRSIFVDCNEDIIISRVMKRNDWNKETVLRILANQMPGFKQRKLADDILDNNKSLPDLELQVKNLHRKYILERNWNSMCAKSEAAYR